MDGQLLGRPARIGNRGFGRRTPENNCFRYFVGALYTIGGYFIVLLLFEKNIQRTRVTKKDLPIWQT